MTLPLPFFKDQLKIFFEKMQIDAEQKLRQQSAETNLSQGYN